MILQPPKLADLERTADSTTLATEGYEELHRTGKTHLARAGLGVEKDGGGKWKVRFRPETTSADAIRDSIAAGREARVLTSISMSVTKRQNCEREAERQRQLDAVEARRRDRVVEA